MIASRPPFCAEVSAPERFDALGLITKAWAILVRDAKMALSYEVGFAMQAAQAGVGVVVTYFISLLVPPSPRFGFDGHPHGYFNYVMINVAFVMFQMTALQSFSRVVRDGQMQGTLEVVISTPTPLSLIVLSGCLWAFAWTLIQTAIELSIAVLFGLDLRHTNVLTALFFLALTVASLSPLGVMSAAFTMIFKQVGPIDYALNNLAYMFGGVYLPVSALPAALQVVGWLLPITHALNGLRAATYGATIAQVAPDALWLVIATVILLPASLWMFERAVHRAKIDGTLGSY